MEQQEYVILVDDSDNEIGREEKMKAHEKALLHRAFSVFLYRRGGSGVEVLLQQREKNKYHCGGLWANSCCSHPRHGEAVTDAGIRRLKEEMGIHLETGLTDVGWFKYRADFDNGLTEHEVDHVLIGTFDADEIPFNTEEVESVRWISLDQLASELKEFPERYVPWIAPAFELAQANYFSSLG